MRISLLDQDPDRIQLLAELSYQATPREDIADAMGVHPDTITTWRKDERVQKAITKRMQERANRIRSQTDTKIEKLLTSDAKLSVDQLLKIREAFAGDMPAEHPDEGSALLAELMKAVHDDPELARKLEAVLPSGRDDA